MAWRIIFDFSLTICKQPGAAQGAHLGTAAAGPRTVPVRSAWPGTKALTFCRPPQRALMLRTGTVRGPRPVSRYAPAQPQTKRYYETKNDLYRDPGPPLAQEQRPSRRHL